MKDGYTYEHLSQNKDGYTYDHLIERLRKEEPGIRIPFFDSRTYTKKVKKVDNVIRK